MKVMKFADKKEAYRKLQDESMLEKDIELLRIKKPDSHALKTGIVDRVKVQKDVLWELLDVVGADEIKNNRAVSSKQSHSDQDIDLKNEAREKAIAKLLETDVEKASQPVLANIARALDIVPENFKVSTLRPILADFVLKLPKTKAAENVLVVEYEQLKADLEEKEQENEDLQSQLDDAELEKEQLSEQLEEEKKNEVSPQLPKKKLNILRSIGQTLKTRMYRKP